MAQSLALKYRPQGFADLTVQGSIVKFLQTRLKLVLLSTATFSQEEPEPGRQHLQEYLQI